MTDPTPHDELPGSRLLKIARVIFDESVLKTVVHPTIADLQRELRDASTNRRTRLVARIRGYRAFWTLVLVAPFAFWQSPAPSRPGALAFPDIAGRLAVTLILLTLISLNGSVLGIWTIAVGIGGTCIAIGIHLWYARHPSLLVVPDAVLARRPEIHVSKIQVGGNVGGLLFVVGSLSAGILGLEVLRWFLLVSIPLGALVGWGLLAWHASRPLRGLPQNRIVLR
jgi:hypothetical protein